MATIKIDRHDAAQMYDLWSLQNRLKELSDNIDKLNIVEGNRSAWDTFKAEGSAERRYEAACKEFKDAVATSLNYVNSALYTLGMPMIEINI